MNLRQLLDLATVGGSALAVLAVLAVIRVHYRRGRNLEDV